jgi:hypothetical protein
VRESRPSFNNHEGPRIDGSGNAIVAVSLMPRHAAAHS